MNNVPFTKELIVYTGSTFDGCIVIRDIHGKPFYISEGDEITFFIKKANEETVEKPVQITLTCDEEIMGEYPFKLSPEDTSKLNGNYYYYVFIRFADGDYYQVVPHTPLKAQTPFGVLDYCENKNKIIAQVPRVMGKSDYEPALNEMTAFIESVDSADNNHLVRIHHINGADIVLIGNSIDTGNITSEELVERINRKIEYIGAENPYLSGLFHTDEMPEQNEYLAAVKSAFGEKFIDVEEILKTPVLSKHSGMIVSSVAFELIKQRTTKDDILAIAHNEYPKCIMQDMTHFNEKGCYAAAKILLKEIFKHE